MQSPTRDGLLPHADHWSLTGLIAGLVLGLCLVVAYLAHDLGGSPRPLMSPPLSSLVHLAIACMTICSLVVQVGVRIVRWQRRIKAQLDLLLDADGPARLRLVGAPPDLPPLPPDNVRAFELGRRMQRDLSGHGD